MTNPDYWKGKDGSKYWYVDTEPYEEGGISWGRGTVLRQFPKVSLWERIRWWPRDFMDWLKWPWRDKISHCKEKYFT